MPFDFQSDSSRTKSRSFDDFSSDGFSSDGFSSSGGFRDMPSFGRDDDADERPASRDDFSLTDRFDRSSQPRRAPRTPRVSRRPSDFQFPWRIVLPVLAVIGIVVLCVVYRDAISAFLSQVLAWVLTVVIILLILRWLIFPRRRR